MNNEIKTEEKKCDPSQKRIPFKKDKLNKAQKKYVKAYINVCKRVLGYQNILGVEVIPSQKQPHRERLININYRDFPKADYQALSSEVTQAMKVLIFEGCEDMSFSITKIADCTK